MSAEPQQNPQQPERRVPGRPFTGKDDPRRNNIGGPRPGSGRPPNWYKRECEKLIQKHGLLPRLAKMGAGHAIPIQTTVWEDGKKRKDGTTGPKKQKLVTERHAAKFDTQIYATDKLMERAWGKPRQEIEHSGSVEIDIVALVQKAEAERGLRPE